MSNDTIPLSPQVVKEVKESFDRMYDRGIDHAILVVQRHMNKLPSPSPNHFNNELDKIIGELENLKSKK